MRFVWLVLAALLVASPASAQRMMVLGAGGPFGSAAFTGPGNVVASANTWVSCSRGYSTAYATGSNNACNVREAKGNTTQDIKILSNGTFDVASYNTFVGTDATASCTIAGTAAACTGASATIHVGDPVSGVGISQPCVVTATNGSTTATVNLSQTATSCGTVGVAETVTFQVAGFATKAYDQSGNVNDMAQGTAGLQPQIFPNCGNNIPCTTHLRSTPLDLTDGSGLSAATVWTISTVSNRVAAQTSFSGVMGGGSTGALYSNSTNTVLTFQGGFAATATASDNAFHALQFIATGSTTSFVNVDGTPGTPGNGGATALGATLVYGASNGNACSCYIYESGIWASNFSAGQNTSMHTNQAAFYGTP